MKNSMAAAAAVLAGLALAGGAHASIVLDQSQTTFNSGLVFTNPGSATHLPVGQSFTAGITGVLAAIDIRTNGDVGPAAHQAVNYSLDIRSGSGLGGTLLGSEVISNVLVGAGQVSELDISNLGLFITAGSQYTFLITAAVGGDILPRGLLVSTSNPYHGGNAFFTPAGLGDSHDYDLWFQTKVALRDPNPTPIIPPAGGVPEPASWALMLLGFGGLGTVLRRRRVALA